MIYPVDEYTRELLKIHGIGPDDNPLAAELTELAAHAHAHDIECRSADLIAWTQAVHRGADCMTGGNDCGCFAAPAQS